MKNAKRGGGSERNVDGGTDGWDAWRESVSRNLNLAEKKNACFKNNEETRARLEIQNKK